MTTLISSPTSSTSSTSSKLSVRMAKSSLRAAVSRERRDRSDAERRMAAEGLRDVFLELTQLRGAPLVGVYVSRRGEPGTRPLRRALADRGVCVVLPVITRSGELRWLPDAMGAPDRLEECGLTWPAVRTATTARLDVVLVPALAVDTRGRRLGRGRDGYDRMLSRLGQGALVLGAVHDSEVYDAAVEPVPEESHDIPVDAVITPSHILYVPREPSLRDRVPAA
jgi:5-formyltetrahydrofolate cyclo-ligase